jgi:toxin YhaV
VTSRRRSRKQEAATAPSAPPPGSPARLVVNGWTFLAWPAFDERWTNLIVSAAKKRAADPAGYQASPEARMLKALTLVIRDHIARDPNAPAYRLRRDLAAWRRVRFFGRYRLFYRFNSAHRIVVLTWLNDEQTVRKEGAKTDPYAVFSAMLSRGDVPADWTALVAGSTEVPDQSQGME